jgi:hypothetical protein
MPTLRRSLTRASGVHPTLKPRHALDGCIGERVDHRPHVSIVLSYTNKPPIAHLLGTYG